MIVEQQQTLKRSKMMTRASRFFMLLAVLFILDGTNGHVRAAQQSPGWSPQQSIPGFHPDTWPPVLVADQNRTVHAFSSQRFDEGEGQGQLAIAYNTWNADRGWSAPSDIVLSPLANEARILDALLDESGIMHLIFLGGNDLGASIFHTWAPAIDVGDAKAWSTLEVIDAAAATPETGELVVDAQGRLVVVYHGRLVGNGVYVVYSSDSGDTWTRPELLFLAPIDAPLIFDLHLYNGESGWIHAIWNTLTTSGQGRGIYYAHLEGGKTEWSEPTVLAGVDSGYGILTPAVIEHNENVYAIFSGLTMRRSFDNGQTWTEPVSLFPGFAGVNGTLSMVVDGTNVLHLFFGQRITGNPDIHGMWHSAWQGDAWSEPEAVVSGPQVSDQIGDSAFDPFNARAVVSQGNTLLVTWRSDPGLKGNGVWYSYQTLDVAESPLMPIPTIASETAPMQMETAIIDEPTLSTQGQSVLLSQGLVDSARPVLDTSPNNVLGLSLVPVLALLAAFIIGYHLVRQRR
jgi:hypothetical protein